MVRQVWSAVIHLFTDIQYSGFIASHPSILPYVGHEFRIQITVQGTFWLAKCYLDATLLNIGSKDIFVVNAVSHRRLAR